MGLFTVHNQGGCPYFFKTQKSKSNMYTFVQPRGVSIFSPKTQKYHVYFCTTKGGGVGPEGTQITKVCTNVHTCMCICHLAPPRLHRCYFLI